MIKSTNRHLTLISPNTEVTIIGGGGGYLLKGVMSGWGWGVGGWGLLSLTIVD